MRDRVEVDPGKTPSDQQQGVGRCWCYHPETQNQMGLGKPGKTRMSTPRSKLANGR